MNTKEKVLELLHNKNEYISGEEIAGAMNISRNSVWKAINQLKQNGYNIEACKSCGYRLIESDTFDEYSIKKHLEGEHKLYIYKEASSSNDIARELARQGEPEGGVVVVESQTNGRGRMGRSFISKSQNGLYMSVILRPTLSSDKCVFITVATAVAVLEAIEELTFKKCEIKWVNDIYINDKKCCGILTEASLDFESGGVQYAVVGIGVNLCQPKGGFDDEIKDIAGGVYENECPLHFKSQLCAKIIENLFKHYSEIEEKRFISKYKEKSNIIGKTVDVHVGGSVISGTAIDIDCNANLVVRDADGNVRAFNSGEARVRKSRE